MFLIFVPVFNVMYNKVLHVYGCKVTLVLTKSHPLYFVPSLILTPVADRNCSGFECSAGNAQGIRVS